MGIFPQHARPFMWMFPSGKVIFLIIPTSTECSVTVLVQRRVEWWSTFSPFQPPTASTDTRSSKIDSEPQWGFHLRRRRWRWQLRQPDFLCKVPQAELWGETNTRTIKRSHGSNTHQLCRLCVCVCALHHVGVYVWLAGEGRILMENKVSNSS